MIKSSIYIGTLIFLVLRISLSLTNMVIETYAIIYNSTIRSSMQTSYLRSPPAKSCDKVWPTRSQQYRYDVKINNEKKEEGETKQNLDPRKYLSTFTESILRVAKAYETNETGCKYSTTGRHTPRCNVRTRAWFDTDKFVN